MKQAASALNGQTPEEPRAAAGGGPGARLAWLDYPAFIAMLARYRLMENKPPSWGWEE